MNKLAQHGGMKGMRDQGLLESALVRPQNLSIYDDPLIAKIAAASACGIIKSHPFQDGNKRTRFVVAVTFLLLNGYYIKAELEVFETIIKLASGEIDKSDLEQWFDQN